MGCSVLHFYVFATTTVQRAFNQNELVVVVVLGAEVVINGTLFIAGAQVSSQLMVWPNDRHFGRTWDHVLGSVSNCGFELDF